MNIERNPQAHRIPLFSYLLLCLLFIILGIIDTKVAQATADEIEIKSPGFGDTYQEALNSALLTSVQQVRGVEAGTAKGLRFDLNAISAADTFLHIDSKIEQMIDTYIQSRGWIKSYAVLDVKKPKNKDDTWQVTIKAVIPMYKQAVPDDKRQSITVLPFRIDGAAFSIDNSSHSPSRVATQLVNAIQTTLVKSEHYAVLNRNFSSELNNEQQLWASGRVNPTEASRLGEQLGADFMLLGQIDRFTLTHKKKELHGVDFGEQKAEVELSYQLIESATGKIIWSDQKRWFKPVKKNKNLFTQDDEPHPLAAIITSLGNEVATDMLKATAPASALQRINDATTSPPQEDAPRPDRPLTPGASDKPVKW